MGDNESAPREVISICMNLEKNKTFVLSSMYRSRTHEENMNINKFIRFFNFLKHEHQMIIGEFNRKDISWATAMSNSDDDCEFIEATGDSFLTQHASTPTRGRGTNDLSLIDLVFTSIEDSIDNISMHAPLGKSDHSLTKIIYRCKPVKQADKIVCNYVKADFNKMIEKLDTLLGHVFREL